MMESKVVTVEVTENGWIMKVDSNGIVHREEWKIVGTGAGLVEGNLNDVKSIPKEVVDVVHDLGLYELSKKLRQWKQG